MNDSGISLELGLFAMPPRCPPRPPRPALQSPACAAGCGTAGATRSPSHPCPKAAPCSRSPPALQPQHPPRSLPPLTPHHPPLCHLPKCQGFRAAPRPHCPNAELRDFFFHFFFFFFSPQRTEIPTEERRVEARRAKNLSPAGARQSGRTASTSELCGNFWGELSPSLPVLGDGGSRPLEPPLGILHRQENPPSAESKKRQ